MLFRAAFQSLLSGLLLAGCAAPTKAMKLGMPLEVERGFCFVNTKYKQQGQELNWDDTTKKLQRYKESEPYVSSGNAWAIGSIVAAVAATPALFVASSAKRDNIDMDEGASTALYAGGAVVGLGGLVMCVVSDAQYAVAGDAYNERLRRAEHGPIDERAYEDAESTK